MLLRQSAGVGTLYSGEGVTAGASGDYWHGQAECNVMIGWKRRQRIFSGGIEMTRELKIEQPFDLELSLTMG